MCNSTISLEKILYLQIKSIILNIDLKAFKIKIIPIINLHSFREKLIK